MRTIGVEDLCDIATGAAVLGTGGGGDPYLGSLIAREAIRRHGPVQLVSPSEIDDDLLVITCGGIGAPTVAIEKLAEGREAVWAVQHLARFLGKDRIAVMSGEVGGANSIFPIVVAAHLGVPLVDADGMGRAFPEVQMVTFTLHGIPAGPGAIADERGNSAIISSIDNRWMERLARTVTIDMGAMAGFALYPMNGRQVKEAAVLDSLSFAQKVGRALREAREAHADPVAAVCAETHGFRVFTGKVVDVERRTVKGFARGRTIIQGLDADAGRNLVVEFQNEHLVARCDGQVLASVPDLIAVLAIDTGEPITTEALRYGFRVAVLGIPCHPKWRTEAGLALAGPRYFGYDVDFDPVESRFSA